MFRRPATLCEMRQSPSQSETETKGRLATSEDHKLMILRFRGLHCANNYGTDPVGDATGYQF